jgi:hypothetical protein
MEKETQAKEMNERILSIYSEAHGSELVGKMASLYAVGSSFRMSEEYKKELLAFSRTLPRKKKKAYKKTIPAKVMMMVFAKDIGSKMSAVLEIRNQNQAFLDKLRCHEQN